MLALITAVAIATSGVAAPAPPTRAQLEARATALKLPHPDRIARDARFGARLVAGGDGSSRIGGDPDLPTRTRWPRCGGHYLSFLAQVRLADVPGAASKHGTLAVFGDFKADSQGVPPIEEAYGRVGKDTCVVVRALKGTLVHRRAPKGVERWRLQRVRPRPTLTVPDIYVAHQRYGLTDAQDDAWWELAGEAANGTLGRRPGGYELPDQMLGWPNPVQDTPLYGCGKRTRGLTHRLLVQLDTGIGDGGVLYISGRPTDLRAGRFGRLCAEFQEG